MERKKFTEEEKSELLKSQYIIKVGNSNATYSNAFKKRAVQENKQGKPPIQIFTESGINLKILGKGQAKRCLERWRKNKTFEDKRGKCRGHGRPRTRPLSAEAENKKLKAENALLKAEVDFLKKLDALERGLD